MTRTIILTASTRGEAGEAVNTPRGYMRFTDAAVIPFLFPLFSLFDLGPTEADQRFRLTATTLPRPTRDGYVKLRFRSASPLHLSGWRQGVSTDVFLPCGPAILKFFDRKRTIPKVIWVKVEKV